MRSSIACKRCRRSKIKCVNEGINSRCKGCESQNRECTYPEPAVSGGVKRRESSVGADGADGERRQRPRKSIPTMNANPTSADRNQVIADALDSKLFTPQIWDELYEIFQLHYSTDLPFMYKPTFLKIIHEIDETRSSKFAASGEFLASFLALTARFHPVLVAHHSTKNPSRHNNPLIASEFYAGIALEGLNARWANTPFANIQRTQAMLMLGLHEWGMCRGARAWLIVGSAIRCAQAMGLQYEIDHDDEPMSRSLALSSDDGSLDPFVRQEIRRRTFWSCFIMDRYLSSGKYRPQMLHARDIRIQLPASEKSFLFGDKVRTLMLGDEDKRTLRRADSHSSNVRASRENIDARSPASFRTQDGEDEVRLETGSEEGLVSLYIKILEIYGKVVKYSCAGGRRREDYPPWDSRGEWYKLNRECIDFQAVLPRQYTLTEKNIQAHIQFKTSTSYTLVHTVYLLCLVMLHREYVPFVPIQCTKPEGPLDEPLFPPDQYDVPPGFWEDSARKCFKAARDIIDLISACKTSKMIVETPVVGFAIYTVAFVGVYCINFPAMDPDGYMCTPLPTNATGAGAGRPHANNGSEAGTKSLEVLKHFQERLYMAKNWTKVINRMHGYFQHIKSDYRKNVQALESGSSENDSNSISNGHLSLRKGGTGGGLDEFKQFERFLQEFGQLEDEDVDVSRVDRRTSSSGPFEGGLADGSSGRKVKREESDKSHAPQSTHPGRTNMDNGPWNAINTASTAPPNQAGAPSNVPFRTYEPYQQTLPSPHQTQLPGTYLPQINSLRSSFSQETTSPRGPSNIPSPSQHNASTIPQQTPPFDPVYGSRWPPNPPSYSMQPPRPAFPNPVQHYPHPSMALNSPHYPTPSPSLQTPHMQNTPGMHGQPAPVLATQKDDWLNNVETRLGGDDFAAFVDGGEIGDWANMSVNRDGVGASWLTAVWGGDMTGPTG